MQGKGGGDDGQGNPRERHDKIMFWSDTVWHKISSQSFDRVNPVYVCLQHLCSFLTIGY